MNLFATVISLFNFYVFQLSFMLYYRYGFISANVICSGPTMALDEIPQPVCVLRHYVRDPVPVAFVGLSDSVPQRQCTPTTRLKNLHVDCIRKSLWVGGIERS